MTYTFDPKSIESGGLARSASLSNEFRKLETTLSDVPSGTDIKQGRENYLIDEGSASSIVLKMDPKLKNYVEGLTLKVKVKAANTGATTVNIDGLGIKPLKRYDNTDLVSNDIATGEIIQISYNGLQFQLLGLPGGLLSEGKASKDQAATSALAAAASSAAAKTSETNAAASATQAAASAVSAQVDKIVWTGAWDATTSYRARDAVSYEGRGFIAKRANVNVTPAEGADWDILADKGAEGAPGTALKSNTIYKAITNSEIYAAQTGDVHIAALDTTISLNPGNPAKIEAAISYETAGDGGIVIKRRVGTTLTEIGSSSDNTVTGLKVHAPFNYDNETSTTMGRVLVFWVDSPTLSSKTEVTYEFYARNPNNAFYLNRVVTSGSRQNYERATSLVMLTEIATTVDSSAQRGLPGPAGPAGPAGSAGSAGPAGPGIRWLGPWNAQTNFAAKDAVFYAGSAFIAKRANRNVTPTVGDDWGYLAQQGDGANISLTDFSKTLLDDTDSETARATLGALKSTGTNLSSADLNSIVSTGFYYQISESLSTIANHYPITSAGTLMVIDVPGTSPLVTQVYFTDDNEQYMRSRSTGNVWSAWNKLGEATEAGIDFQGEWQSTTSYSISALVRSDNSLWIARLANRNSKPSKTNTNWTLVYEAPHYKRNEASVIETSAFLYAQDAQFESHLAAMDVTLTVNPGNKVRLYAMLNIEAQQDSTLYIKATPAGGTGVEVFSGDSAGGRTRGLSSIGYDNNLSTTMDPVMLFVPVYDPGLTIATAITFSIHYRGTAANRSIALNRTLTDDAAQERVTSTFLAEEIPVESSVAHGEEATSGGEIITLNDGTPLPTLGKVNSLLIRLSDGLLWTKGGFGWASKAINFVIARLKDIKTGEMLVWDGGHWINRFPFSILVGETDNPSATLGEPGYWFINTKKGKVFRKLATGWDFLFDFLPNAHQEIDQIEYRLPFNTEPAAYSTADTWQVWPLNALEEHGKSNIQWLRSNQFRVKPGRYKLSFRGSFNSEGHDLVAGTQTPRQVAFNLDARIEAQTRLVVGHNQPVVDGLHVDNWWYAQLEMHQVIEFTQAHECSIQVINIRGSSAANGVRLGNRTNNARYGRQTHANLMLHKVGDAVAPEPYQLKPLMVVGYHDVTADEIDLGSGARYLGPAVVDPINGDDLYVFEKSANNSPSLSQYDLAAPYDISNFEDNNKYFETPYNRVTAIVWNATQTQLGMFTPADRTWHRYVLSRPGELETLQVREAQHQLPVVTGTSMEYCAGHFSEDRTKLFMLACSPAAWKMLTFTLSTAGDLSTLSATATEVQYVSNMNPKTFTIRNDEDLYLVTSDNRIVQYRLPTRGTFTSTLSLVETTQPIAGVSYASIQWVDDGSKLLAMDRLGKRVIELGYL